MAKSRGARRVVALAATIGLTGAVFGACGSGDGDDDGNATAAGGALATPEPTESTEGTGQSTGDVPLAAGLEEPPGPADRGDPPNGLEEIAVAITTADGDVLGWCMLLAEFTTERTLEGVTDFEGYAGLVTVYEEDVVGLYATYQYEMTTSMAWFDAGGGLLATDDTEPCDTIEEENCPTYTPETWHRFMVEVAQGQLDDTGVEEGSRIAVGGPCVERS